MSRHMLKLRQGPSAPECHMGKNTLSPFLLRFFAAEEELIDQGARSRFSIARSPGGGNKEDIGEIIRSAIDEMPRIPVFAGTLLSALNNSEATASIISRMVSEDPFMAAQILKNVNSPYYGFPTRIADLQHAITLLGINQIHLLVLYHGMRRTLPNTRTFLNLQSQSVLLSCLTAAAAELVCPSKVPLFSTLGLLSNIGNGVIYLAQHKHPEIEEAAPLLNHFTIGSMLLIHWELPEAVHETIRLMGKAKYAPPSEIPESYRQNVAILTVAQAVLDCNSATAQEVSTYLDEYVPQAGFGLESVDAVARDRIVPLLRQKGKVLPQVVRNFVGSTSNRAVKIRRTVIGAREKQALKRTSEQASGGPEGDVQNSANPAGSRCAPENRTALPQHGQGMAPGGCSCPVASIIPGRWWPREMWRNIRGWIKAVLQRKTSM